MKLMLPLLVLISCAATCQTATVTEKDFSKLSWLEGTWVRSNSKPGRSGSERWVKGGDKELIGWGVSMRGADTSFVEKLKIVTRAGAIYYVSDVPENPKPVDFRITSIDDNNFVCENPSHDFPKKISYHRDGNKVKAVISGDGKEIEYLFERKNP